MSEKIDFVICWVDNNDLNWQEEKNKYNPNHLSDNRDIRYRDWDNLKYWFRGVEKFAPWVNKIHFVTWGHVPSWLDVNHSKVNIVKHEDYIPKEYLPTFSARPIEINLHRIKNLSEKFVFFNDDMFLLRPVKKRDFFKKGKPRDIASLDIAVSADPTHGNAKYNAVNIINQHFNKKEVLKRYLLKWYNPKYKEKLIRTLLLTPWNNFTGFYTPHLPNSFLKNTFKEVWEKEESILKLTSSHKFRERYDVTQYLFKFWQLASGNFHPRSNIGKLYKINSDEIIKNNLISKPKFKILCLNDTEDVVNFTETKERVNKEFEKLLKFKSSYEL